MAFWARGRITLVVVLYLPQELVFLNHLPEQVETVIIVQADTFPIYFCVVLRNKVM
jgi:hypothetical protein